MIFQKTNFKLNCSQYDIVDVSRSNRKQPFFHINCINSGRNYLMGNDYFNQTTFGIKCRVVKCEVNTNTSRFFLCAENIDDSANQ